MEVRAGPQTGTDRRGAFRLRLEQGDVVGLRVSRSGFAAVEVPLVQAGERLRIVMQAGVALRVRALDESGNPLAAAFVRVTRARDVRDATFEYASTTDSQGEHVFLGLPPSLVAWVDASKEGVGWSGLRRMQLPQDGESVAEIIIKSGRTLSGRITNASTGDPIAGARVGISHRMAAAVQTGADGIYVLPGWTGRGVQTLHVLCEGYGREKAHVGREDTYDFELHRGFAITGRILASSGTAVTNAHVAAIAMETRNGKKVSSSATATADESGHVTLGSLRRDMAHTLLVSADGHGRLFLDVDPPEPGIAAKDVGDILLPEARSIAGRAEVTPGSPARRVPIYLKGHNDDRARLREGEKPLVHDINLRDRLLTDDLGRFRFTDLAPGTYEVLYSPDGTSPVTRGVTLGTREDVSGLVLRPAGRHSIRVRVVDSAGPIEGVVVSASLESGESLASTTDSAGTCEFRTDMPIRSLRTAFPARATRRSFMPTVSVTPLPGQEEVVFVLREAAKVAGQVLTADGGAFQNARVYLEPGDQLLAHTDARGRFHVPVPIDGRYTLRAEGIAPAGGGRDAVGRLMAGRSSIQPSTHQGVLVIQLRAVELNRQLHVLVLDPLGGPVRNVGVSAVGRHGLLRRSAQTDVDGRAVLDHLPATDVGVAIGGESMGGSRDNDPSLHWMRPRPLRVLPCGQRVELRFRRGFDLRGVLQNAQGSPVSGALVTCWRVGERLATARSDKHGKFSMRIAEDEQGPLEIRAERSTAGTRQIRGARSGIWPRADAVTIRMHAVR